MATPLPIGTQVRIIQPPALDGEEPSLSAVTIVAAIQWVTPEGEIVEEAQDEFQYLLDAEEPYPDIAVRPEHIKAV